MDLDAYVAAHQADWARLDALVRRRRRLTGDEVDELVTLYQRTTTHLSALRSAGHDPALVARLSGRVARARAAVTGAHAPAVVRCVAGSPLVSFPAMAYRAALVVAGHRGRLAAWSPLLLGWWVARSPGGAGRAAAPGRGPQTW